MITVVWAMAAAAALTLALVHTLVWMYDRRALPSLTFAIVAVALACMAPIELRLMDASTPEDYGKWVRWLQVPIFVAIVGIVLFVRFHLGTGRVWLAWTIIGLRSVILLANFALYPNFNFREITSLERVQLLGQQVSTVGEAQAGTWQWLAITSLILLAVFVVDAAVTLWRSGGRDARRKAVVVGGAISVFLVFSVGQTQSVIWGQTRMPVMVSPPFLITVLAMAFELSRDLLRAVRVADDLHDREMRLDLAVRAAGLGVWVWDVARGKLQMSEQARSLHGLPDEIMDADRWLATIHADDVGSLRNEVTQALASREDFVAEYRVRLPDDAVRWILARGRSESDAKGRPTAMRGVLRDITESKRASNETDQLRRELAHAGRVNLLGQLSSALAHELNQPLGAILRNAEAAEMLLQRPSIDVHELRAIVSDIKKDDRRAGAVIDRLRALLSRRSVEVQPLTVDGMVQDVLSLVRPDAAARHVTLDVATTPDLPPVLGDRVHLSQVLLNLVINGMDAVSDAQDGDRRVLIETRRGAQGFAEVTVTDSGRGIAPEFVERVFEPFFTTKAHGMGIGLPVSRTIVEAHGGRLWAENGARQGATFRFTLPLAEGALP